jgi:flagellar basal-body rod protein FlgB
MNFSPLSSSIERYLDLLSARQRVAVSNIANAATPGYKTRDIDFQFEFRSELEAQPDVVDVPGMKGAQRRQQREPRPGVAHASRDRDPLQRRL